MRRPNTRVGTYGGCTHEGHCFLRGRYLGRCSRPFRHVQCSELFNGLAGALTVGTANDPEQERQLAGAGGVAQTARHPRCRQLRQLAEQVIGRE